MRAWRKLLTLSDKRFWSKRHKLKSDHDQPASFADSFPHFRIIQSSKEIWEQYFLTKRNLVFHKSIVANGDELKNFLYQQMIPKLVKQGTTSRSAPPLSVKMYASGPRPIFTVCIEGNIGSGKTTLLNYFSQSKDILTFAEPIHKWRDLNDCNLFDMMYTDPERWCHLFQTYVQLTMLENHLLPCSKPIKMIERSIHSARHCFVENHYRSKLLSMPEYKVYDEWYKMITLNMDCKIDLFVYLKTDPHKLYKRICERGRKEESVISLEYLRSLHNVHEEWLSSSTLITPILVIDANADLPTMYKKYQHYSSQILGQAESLCKSFSRAQSSGAPV